MGIQEDRQEDRKGPLTGRDLSDQSSWEDLDRFERLGEKLRIHNLSMGAACNVPEDVDFVCSTPGGERLTSSAISKATQKIQIAQKEEEEKDQAHKRLIHQIEEMQKRLAELKEEIRDLDEKIDAFESKYLSPEDRKRRKGESWDEETERKKLLFLTMLENGEITQEEFDKWLEQRNARGQKAHEAERLDKEIADLSPDQQHKVIAADRSGAVEQSRTMQEMGLSGVDNLTLNKTYDAYDEQNKVGEDSTLQASETSRASLFRRKGATFSSASKGLDGDGSYKKPIQSETGVPDAKGHFALSAEGRSSENKPEPDNITAKAEIENTSGPENIA